MRRKRWLLIPLAALAVLGMILVLGSRRQSAWPVELWQYISSDKTVYIDYSKMFASMPSGAAPAGKMPPVRMRMTQFGTMKPGLLKKHLEGAYSKARGWTWTDISGSVGATPYEKQGSVYIISKGSAATSGMGAPKDDYVVYMEDLVGASSSFGSRTKEIPFASVMEVHPMQPLEVWLLRAQHIGSDPFESSIRSLMQP